MIALVLLRRLGSRAGGRCRADAVRRSASGPAFFRRRHSPTQRAHPARTVCHVVADRVAAGAEHAPATFADERAEVRYAKSLAFAWLMTADAAFAERALEVMQGVAFPPRGGDLGEPHNEGEVVAQYAVAYDILHSYAADNDPQALQAMRSILGEEADRLWKGIVIGKVGLGPFKVKVRLHETPHLDNWHIRAYGGLGLAAMALSEYSSGEGTPLEWADRALEMVTSSLDFQIEERDGGYAEGPFYSRYAADVYLPYLFALKNRTGLDLFADPKIEKMHEWSLNLRLPNGRRPNIDDGHLDDFYGHYLAAVQANGGGIHRWDWENNERGLYVRQFCRDGRHRPVRRQRARARADARSVGFYARGWRRRLPQRLVGRSYLHALARRKRHGTRARVRARAPRRNQLCALRRRRDAGRRCGLYQF